ncbi:MAG: hypothetical protein NWF04_01065 [Candidatus Bathyarchaeota archaeon]|nr:hypothetical protein [Candidatus Bathyarchaeota archaeon]
MNMMKTLKKPLVTLALVFFLMAPALLSVNVANADTGIATGDISVVFSDNGLDTMTVSDAVGDYVGVEIAVSGATNLLGFHFDLSWNPAVLDIYGVYEAKTSVDPPGPPPAYEMPYIGTSPNLLEDEVTGLFGSNPSLYNHTGGSLKDGLSQFRLSSPPSVTTLSEFPIATVWFTVVGNGQSDIVISNAEVFDIEGAGADAGANSAVLTVNPPPTFMTADEFDAAKDTFAPSETVYAVGTGLPVSTTYPLYVTEDATWADGMAIPAGVVGTATSITTDSNGDVDAVIYASALPGLYDVVVDVNQNGVYDANVDILVDNVVTTGGFLVIPEYTLGALAALAACFVAFVAFKKGSFSKRI